MFLRLLYLIIEFKSVTYNPSDKELFIWKNQFLSSFKFSVLSLIIFNKINIKKQPNIIIF